MRNWLLKHLYRAVTIRDLQKGWKDLNEAKKQQYSEEAKAILEYEVFYWLKDEMERNAMRMLYLKSKTEEDLLFNKALLHAESERMKAIKKISQL